MNVRRVWLGVYKSGPPPHPPPHLLPQLAQLLRARPGVDPARFAGESGPPSRRSAQASRTPVLERVERSPDAQLPGP